MLPTDTALYMTIITEMIENRKPPKTVIKSLVKLCMNKSSELNSKSPWPETPVFEALKRGIKVYAVKENQTELDVTKEKLFPISNIVEVESYDNLLNLI